MCSSPVALAGTSEDIEDICITLGQPQLLLVSYLSFKLFPLLPDILPYSNPQPLVEALNKVS